MRTAGAFVEQYKCQGLLVNKLHVINNDIYSFTLIQSESPYLVWKFPRILTIRVHANFKNRLSGAVACT